MIYRIKEEDFKNALMARYPGKDVKVSGYGAIVDDNIGAHCPNKECDAEYTDSSDPTVYTYTRLVAHVIIDESDLYVTSGAGLVGSVKDIYESVFKSIDSLMIYTS